MKKLFIFFILFFTIMSIGLAVHLQFDPAAKNFLIQSYCINTLMAAAAVLLLKRGIGKKTDNLAVIYFLTIAIKLLVYITFFYPNFNFDGELNRMDFFIFFIPYALGLIFEISFLTKNNKKF